MPLGLVVAGANRNDFKLLRATLESVVLRRPRPTRRRPQGLCLDKGHDYREVYALLARCRYTAHVRARGDEASAKRTRGHRARRWVVERTHSWTNRFRALLVRWEKKTVDFLASLHLACAYTCLRRAGPLRWALNSSAARRSATLLHPHRTYELNSGVRRTNTLPLMVESSPLVAAPSRRDRFRVAARRVGVVAEVTAVVVGAFGLWGADAAEHPVSRPAAIAFCAGAVGLATSLVAPGVRAYIRRRRGGA